MKQNGGNIINLNLLKFRITGASPLILHSEKGANPLNPDVKELKSITSKRKKADEDMAMISFLEWKLAMYFEEKHGPGVPGLNIEAVMRDAAKLSKQGKDITRGLRCLDNFVPLEYSGPRDIQKMWDSGRFTDIRSVVVQRARLMRCRPIFTDWKLVFTIQFNPEVLDQQKVINCMVLAGSQIGLCDFRPRFGQFTVELVD
jgi:hypothetical protein